MINTIKLNKSWRIKMQKYIQREDIGYNENTETLDSGLLMKLEWTDEETFDDGKQNNTLTGAAHPGCCKQ